MHNSFPFPFVYVDHDSVCDICHYARQKEFFSLSTNRVHKYYEIKGLIFIHSVHSHKYFLTILNYHSRFTWIIFYKSKFEIHNLDIKLLTIVETQYHCHVKITKSDNGFAFLITQQNGRLDREY